MIRNSAARARFERRARPVSFGEAYYGPSDARVHHARARWVTVLTFLGAIGLGVGAVLYFVLTR